MAAPTASRDRITRIHVTGFRSLADVTLDLDGLTVLIGDNGSGKSSILEALETLRYFSSPGASVEEFFSQHPWPVRGGQGKLAIEVDVKDSGAPQSPRIHYALCLVHNDRGRIGVASESLTVGPLPGHSQALHAIRRKFDDADIFDQGQRKLVRVNPSPMHLLLTQLLNDPPREATERQIEQEAIHRLGAALRNIEVHVPFESMAAWAARRTGRKSAMRESNILRPARQLEMLAANLGNVFHSLKNDHGTSHWNETLDYVRLGLGDDIDDVAASADAAGGQHAISIRFKSVGLIPAIALSDGTLSYLAFVAMLRLPSSRSLLAFDEPELHLHPGLLVRVLSMFESVAESCPVVLATHSDRLLDALQEPAKSVVLCDLDETRAARLLRPDKAMLTKWLAKYRGLGDIRATGLQDAVIPRPEIGQ